MNKSFFLVALICLNLFTACDPKMEPTFLSYELKVNGKDLKKDEEGSYSVKTGNTITIKATTKGPQKNVKWKLYYYGISSENIGESAHKNITTLPPNTANLQGENLLGELQLNDEWKATIEKGTASATSDKKTITLRFKSAGDKRTICNQKDQGTFVLKVAPSVAKQS